VFWSAKKHTFWAAKKGTNWRPNLTRICSKKNTFFVHKKVHFLCTFSYFFRAIFEKKMPAASENRTHDTWLGKIELATNWLPGAQIKASLVEDEPTLSKKLNRNPLRFKT